MTNNDMFAKLIAISWRGISFPVAGFRASLQQDLVEHKYVDRDGAHIESVGRAPLQFHAQALFRNGIVPGPSEHWGVLYPDGWRDFIAAAADRRTGVLMHPELGGIDCKLSSAETTWNSSARDGVDVEITWVESTDNGAGLLGLLASDSPISSAFLGALDLDATLSNDARLLARGLTGPRTPAEPSFADMLNGLQAIADTSVAVRNRTAGILDGAVYRARLLADSATRAADPKQWPVKRAAARLEAAAHDLQHAALASRDVSVYRTPRAMSLSAIASAVQRDVNTVIRLNPALVRRATVPADTDVRYYSDAA